MPEYKGKIELLAPAKDLNAGIAAVKCGADAVYIGSENFGARKAASNNIEDIQKLIDFAHPFYVKVYAALNTILNDDELTEAEKLITKLYHAGIDGLIIQDVGLLELDLPPIPIIASTQMHNSNVDKVKFLEDVGFSRAILARELTLEQIRQIRSQTSIELECFIQGALCVCASGQCYMSYALGGRSGNRGQCAQPCRKLYSLKDSSDKTICKDRYLLSLKDMNLSEHIEQLLDAGISFLKIEGRLKDVDYVANVTAYYRQILDDILRKKNLHKESSGSVQFDFSPALSKTFNRGFTDYGLRGCNENIGSIDTPKSIGQMIGKVSKVTSNNFEIASTIELHNADGICFFDDANDLQGTIVNRVERNKIYPQKLKDIKAGMIIYRNFDHAFNQLIEKIPADRRIKLSMYLSETSDGIALQGTDEDDNSATIINPCKKEPAQKTGNVLENISMQLSKLGNTIFTCDDIKIDLAEIYFFPVSALNKLKRDLVKAVLEQRLKNRPVLKSCIAKNDVPYPQQCLDYTANIFNSKAGQFYKRHGVTQIDPAAETGLKMAGKQVMKTKYCIRQQLKLCTGHKAAKAQPLILTDQQGNQFRLNFRCNDCGMDIYLEP